MINDSILEIRYWNTCQLILARKVEEFVGSWSAWFKNNFNSVLKSKYIISIIQQKQTHPRTLQLLALESSFQNFKFLNPFSISKSCNSCFSLLLTVRTSNWFKLRGTWSVQICNKNVLRNYLFQKLVIS